MNVTALISNYIQFLSLWDQYILAVISLLEKHNTPLLSLHLEEEWQFILHCFHSIIINKWQFVLATHSDIEVHFWCQYGHWPKSFSGNEIYMSITQQERFYDRTTTRTTGLWTFIHFMVNVLSNQALAVKEFETSTHIGWLYYSPFIPLYGMI